jgi:CRISPR-associated protein Cas1
MQLTKKEKNLGFKKQINVSKRGYKIIYIEKAKVYVNNGTLVFSQKEELSEKTYNIPYLNTSILMLGVGTSITNEAVRLAANNSLIIMFVNSSLSHSSSTDESFNILSPSSEYKPNEYTQQLSKIFFSDTLRLEKAKQILKKRLLITEEVYQYFIKKGILSENILNVFQKEASQFNSNIEKAENTNKLLIEEALYTKKIYKVFAKENEELFLRNSKGKDPINRNLTNINYMLYGLSASMLTALNIPYVFAFLHGKTRRGALVFDVADLYKDAVSIPLSFYFQKYNLNEREVRKETLYYINKLKIFDNLFKNFMEIIQ